MTHRLGLLVLILLLGAGLYALPKQVLNNLEADKDPLAQTAKQEQEKPNSGAKPVEADHKITLDAASAKTFAGMEEALAAAPEADKASLLDSMVSFLEGKAQFGRAAQLASQAAELKPSFERLKKAGQLNTDAAGFAVDEAKKQAFLQDAQRLVEKAQKEQPENLELKVILAQGYVMGSEPMQGIFLLREVLQEEPKHRQGLFQMSLLSIQSGQWDKAVERLEDYTRYYPKDPEGWFYLGMSYKQTQLKAKARASFEKVLELDQDPKVEASVNEYLNDL